ncbi:protein Spindly [Microcaecilia unicolor]|uniref:Protein Spindly n=1 Tax=Microcaecilia unicolor TaxID=1415580 RepID=A0A6P7ZG71_9AMPH|nr:protein Spindly [Microcaecilia unicolor]XP_030078337.1 protein Spindly [Microcaecilia unicolor]XP_030078338.1 protein Spindly [Microcaecilia unicolor]XP_030078340.1 protein Spindly [Microcaecilia unicolor]XP_030078341.1 protein Spindly [Microcaecilia unicolor]XP_030078342.1 protein Spindly [Microcaecilia unicolor]
MEPLREEMAEELRRKTAHFDLKLLEIQKELQNQLETQQNEMNCIIENLKQEKYSLQKEIELKNQILQSTESECEIGKLQQKSFIEQLERRHGREISEYKNELKKLRAEVDEARLNEGQLKHKLDSEMQLLTKKSREFCMLPDCDQETLSSEMLSLQFEKTELENEQAILKEVVNELRCQQQQLQVANNNLTLQSECLQKEKEEKENEAVSYFTALQDARERNRELQDQLDEVQLGTLNPKKKGNSLFAEVEDRREKMERHLKNMKVQYQSLQKQHAFSRQECQRMKVQIASLLRMKSSQVNHEQLERLQSMVAQKNSEIEDLIVQVRQLEKCKENQEPGHFLSCPSGDETYYVDLLKMKLEQSVKENEKIKDELYLQRMKSLTESQRVLELERKLFTNDEQLQRWQSENMKLRVTLDELKMKYEPLEMTEIPLQKRRKEVLPVELPSDKVYGTLAFPAKGSQNKDELKPDALTSVETTNAAPKGELTPVTVQANVSLPLKYPEETKNGEPLKKKKRVQILEELSNVQVVSETNRVATRLTPVASKSLAEKHEEKEEISHGTCDRKWQEKMPEVLYVPSKPASVSQCPQQ